MLSCNLSVELVGHVVLIVYTLSPWHRAEPLNVISSLRHLFIFSQFQRATQLFQTSFTKRLAHARVTSLSAHVMFAAAVIRSLTC